MYRLNKKTQRLELHFEKSEYLALSEAQKSNIKSAFLWSKAAGAWVSRSTNSHWRAEKIAQELGHNKDAATGERLSYAEELARKADKAEARADRYEEYAENAEARAKQLQSALQQHRGDIAFFTQPIIAGHSGSKAFANYRNRLYARYDRGFEEYKKSSYYQDRAATARETAANAKLKDRVYLDNKIKECNKSLKAIQSHIVEYEEQLHKIECGQTVLSLYDRKPITAEQLEARIEERLEKYDYLQGKLEFFEDCLNDLGGIKHSKETINKGDAIKIRGEWAKVLSVNPTTVRILNSLGWDWMKYPYSEIQDHKAAQ